MSAQLAQAHIVKFQEHPSDPANKVLVDNLHRFKTIAENQPGFLLQVDENNKNSYIHTYISVWENLRSFNDYVSKSVEYRDLMDINNFQLFLWWIEEHHIPATVEVKIRYHFFAKNGPTPSAFSIEAPFPEQVTLHR